MFRELIVETRNRSELVDMTARVARALGETGMKEGLVTVYVPHTTAGVTINEHADPDVAEDILSALESMVPWDGPYAHEEGNFGDGASFRFGAVLVTCPQNFPEDRPGIPWDTIPVPSEAGHVPEFLAGDLPRRVRRPPHPWGQSRIFALSIRWLIRFV